VPAGELSRERRVHDTAAAPQWGIFVIAEQNAHQALFEALFEAAFFKAFSAFFSFFWSLII
jgi:hypothetical protein